MPNANAANADPAVTAAVAHSPSAAPALLRRGLRAAALAVGLAGLAYLLASARIPCGFARMFHLACPGCGSTRAMLALASGDLPGLLRFNPLAPFLTLLVVALAGQAFASVLATGSLQRVGEGRVGALVSRGILVVAVLEVVLWVARFGGFLGGPVPV